MYGVETIVDREIRGVVEPRSGVRIGNDLGQFYPR